MPLPQSRGTYLMQDASFYLMQLITCICVELITDVLGGILILSLSYLTGVPSGPVNRSPLGSTGEEMKVHTAEVTT